jgi:hypothetical protein
MLKTFVKLNLYDKDLKLLHSQAQESRSWMLHFFHLLYCVMGYSSNTLAAINNIAAVARTLNACVGTATNLLIAGGCAGNLRQGRATDTTSLVSENYGIVVGTNNAAVTPLQDALQTKIVHGEAAGQLLYGGTEIYGLTFADPNGSMNIRRYFTNVAGGDIDVAECGICAQGYISVVPTYDCFCICRDIVGPVVTVSNGEILSVVYTVQITV